MKKSAKTIVHITVLVVLAALVGVNIYAINAERLSGNSLPMPLGFGLTVVLSGSMEPELSVGDLLVVAEADVYQVGDVIVYQSGGSGVVHRIMDINGETIVTKGDANNTSDAPITSSQIKGVVICAVPMVGYLVDIIKTPLGTMLLLGGAIFLMEASFRKDKKKDQEERDAIKKEIERLKNTDK